MDPIAQIRRKLPIFHCKSEILEKIQLYKTTVFMGETGSGKSTQIPQYLLEAGYARDKCIAVTQPRRVGAISLAKRVAMEVKTELGVKVGYSVRFDVCVSAATKIKFLTDGILLRESIKDNLLLKYSVVVLDEAHERTLNNDILLGIVKLAQHTREERNFPPLKIIVMSATLDHMQFSRYFDNCPVYSIPGRYYHIEVLQPTKEQKNYVYAALATVFKIHQNEERGDILVFCTGQEEIDYMVSETIETAKLLPADVGAIYPHALYAALPFEQQSNVFRPVPAGGRKVIYSTNIAETSITIPNIKYVVDTGMAKIKSYNSSSGFGVLLNQRISKAQAIQRGGRSGRESEGKCYRLYSDEVFNNMKEFTEPEILRCCLANTILEMVAMGIKNVSEFDFIDKPSAENISAAVNTLKLLDAVIENDGLLELTECGQKMVVFPLDPRFSKIIIESTKYGCTDEILTIVSLLSVKSIFFTNVTDRKQMREIKEKFYSYDSDLLLLLEVYKEFKRKGNKRKNGGQELDKHAWCKENFIDVQNMNKVIAIRKQLSALCRENDIPPICCRESDQIKKCLLTGFFMNVAFKQDYDKYKLLENDQEVQIHPSSCLFKKKDATCCIYTELIQTTNIYMRNVTCVREEMLCSVKPDYFKTKMCRITVLKSTYDKYRSTKKSKICRYNRHFQ